MLKQVAREEAVHSGISMKVVERCGVNLQSQLPSIKTPQQCRTECIVHTNGGKGHAPCQVQSTEGSALPAKMWDQALLLFQMVVFS